ncbi:MAG TPA: aldo/keto reductase [Chryseolinea sp.]|nr:aldo/keto reductase [Chryseolinea sp.]
MKTLKLGSQGLHTSQLGLGCMGMSEFYGTTDETESINVIHRAIDLGITFLDTSDAYGPHKNEILVGKAIRGKRDRVTVATKFGIVRDPNDPTKRGLNGKPDYVRSSCDASLQRLGVDAIDLYYLHRKDPNTPIEETVGAMAQLVKAGKIKAIGLSEVSPETIRKAHAIHPISALQTEYSLWSRDPEDELLGVCQELGIAFVAYSPLGRGFLTGQIKKFEDFEANDWRRLAPRFQGENFDKNLVLVQHLEALAQKKGCTPSQLALAWVLAQGDFIFPIPGTKRMKYLEENNDAMKVVLTPEDHAILNAMAPKGIAAGDRYNVEMMKLISA